MPDTQSPCIGVCRISMQAGWCEGCFRTREEIAGWSSMMPDRKCAVLKKVEERRRMSACGVTAEH